jgi:hypothetical protein
MQNRPHIFVCNKYTTFSSIRTVALHCVSKIFLTISKLVRGNNYMNSTWGAQSGRVLKFSYCIIAAAEISVPCISIAPDVGDLQQAVNLHFLHSAERSSPPSHTTKVSCWLKWSLISFCTFRRTLCETVTPKGWSMLSTWNQIYLISSDKKTKQKQDLLVKYYHDPMWCKFESM